MSKFRTVGITTLFVAALATPAYADGWVDNYFDAAVVTQPGVYESQQRTYATFGSFQGRIKTHSDNLFTISKPSINAGCGGIDIFMGGFSFLNPDYLVEKAEKLIAVAPYVAFDMALNELCTTCATVKDRAENIINFLNGLQLDECKAAKAVVTTAVDAFKSGSAENAEKSIGSSLKKGAENLWSEAKTAFVGDPGGETKKTINNSGISAAGKTELLKEGSLLKTIGDRMGLSSSLIKQMRALVGDIDVSYDGEYAFRKRTYCSEATYDALIKKPPYIKEEGPGGDGLCSNISGKSVQNYVNEKIDAIASKISSNLTSKYTEDEKNFISRTPIPVLYVLNTASKYGDAQLSTAAENIKPLAAYAYAFYIFVELTRNVEEAINAYQEYFEACTGKEMAESHVAGIKTLLERAKDRRYEAYRGYATQADDSQKLNGMLASFQQQQEVIDLIVKDNKFAMGRKF